MFTVLQEIICIMFICLTIICNILMNEVFVGWYKHEFYPRYNFMCLVIIN